MARTVDELISALGAADANEQALALAELVQRGKAAAPALRSAYSQSRDADVRSQIAQALAEIGDPDAVETFAQMLNDADDHVRARGAQGLAHIGDPRALDALVRTIDDFEDVLHSPYSLSVYTLVDIGPRALAAVAPLLKAQLPMTRARAALVVRTIASKMPGVTDGDALWRSLGSYDPNGPQAERDRAADLWSEWVRQHPVL